MELGSIENQCHSRTRGLLVGKTIYLCLPSEMVSIELFRASYTKRSLVFSLSPHFIIYFTAHGHFH